MMTFRAWHRLALLAVTACSLSACFDLDQKISVGRDGAGRYEMRISAKGMVGEALKEGKDNLLKPNKSVTSMVERDGKVTRMSRADFKTLSDLAFSNEAISLTVTHRSLFGLGPAHVRFRRTFLVDNARKEHSRDRDSGETGEKMLATFFGDHEYTFTLVVPGSVERIAPVKVNGRTVKPKVTGDFYHGHTIVWRMPLSSMLASKRLTFEVDFSALGTLGDSQTRLAEAN